MSPPKPRKNDDDATTPATTSSRVRVRVGTDAWLDAALTTFGAHGTGARLVFDVTTTMPVGGDDNNHDEPAARRGVCVDGVRPGCAHWAVAGRLADALAVGLHCFPGLAASDFHPAGRGGDDDDDDDDGRAGQMTTMLVGLVGARVRLGSNVLAGEVVVIRADAPSSYAAGSALGQLVEWIALPVDERRRAEEEGPLLF